jgi:peptidyl-Asp metalloendopeptidase
MAQRAANDQVDMHDEVTELHLNVNRLWATAARVAVTSLGFSGVAIAGPLGLAVLGHQAPSSAMQLPPWAKADSGVIGTLDAAALSAPTLEITLADGTTLEARLQRTASDSKKGTQSWIGTFDDAPGSVLVLSKTKGVVTGFANYKDQTLEILPAAGGKHVLFAVDTDHMAMGDGIVEQTTGGADALSTTTSDYGLGTTTLAAGSAVVQDVLVLYTAAAATAYGQATLESMITSAVESGNQAYQNSNAAVTINLVGLQQSSLTESSTGMQATLTALKQNSTVRSLRDKLAADMVVLVSQDTGACGYSSLQITTTTLNGVTTSNTDAYAVVASKCLSSESLAHELGHLQGLDHNRENKANSNRYPYSFGYRVCASDGFRDVMSYPCSTGGVPRVLQFSNPNVYYNGYATGVSYEASPTTSAENARTLNNTAVDVAAYRVGTSSTSTTTPAAPSSLAVQGSAYNSVTVGWTDNSTNETGFKVQRSPDGVTFTEIASVGADTRSYQDVSVSALTTYYYRVRAFNSAGGSAFSNTASVKTPAKAALSSFILSAATIPGCKTTTGTLTLTAPAPTGGFPVSISDTLANATSPTTVTIAAGATTMSFTVKSTPVTTNQIGTVSAVGGGATFSQPLTLRRIGMQSVTLGTTSIVGGSSVSGVAKLECAAPATTISATLWSSLPTVAKPTVSSLTFPAGVQSLAFKVSTARVTAVRKPTIYGKANGLSKSIVLTVNP